MKSAQSILLLLVSITYIVSGCSEEPRFPEITEDYCAEIEPMTFEKFSDQFPVLADTTNSETGVLVLEEGDISMLYRAWLSDAAIERIDIQYFIFTADNIGLIALDYLLRAADRGVKVRLLIDDIMVEADADELIALDSHPNLEIRIYNPIANIGKKLPQKLFTLVTDFSDFNQRMHNKTFIMDDQVVITGGRNIADEYFDYDHEYNFRDRDVLLVGNAVNETKQSFEEFWYHPLSVPIETIISVSEEKINASGKFEYLRQYACSPENYWPELREKIQNAPALFNEQIESGEFIWTENVSFISDDPGKNDERGLGGGGISTDALIELIQGANESISIQSPYLVTTELSQQLFKDAIDRGVEVKILTNSLLSTDNLEAFSGYKRDRKTLLDIGVQIYEYRPDAAIRFEVMTGALQRKINFTPTFGLHAKSMVVDEEISVIGTFNLDPRSANLNTECIVVIEDSTVSKRLYNIMEIELLEENAWQTTLAFNPDKEAGFKKRLKLWFRGIVPESIL